MATEWGKRLGVTGFSQAQEMMGAAGFMNLAGTLTGLLGKRAQTKAQEAFQQYSNTMVNLSAGTQQDAITLNEILMGKASAEKAKVIQEQGMTAEGEIITGAAAAGVSGKSVQVSEAHAAGNAAAAEVQRQREYKYALLGFDHQRTNIAVAAKMQQDVSDYSAGSTSQLLSGLLSSGSKLFSIFGVD